MREGIAGGGGRVRVEEKAVGEGSPASATGGKKRKTAEEERFGARILSV